MNVSVTALRQLKEKGQRFAAVTAYDSTFAVVAEQAGIDVLLVGDSLGMVVQGRESTVRVTIDEMVYHTSLVSRGAQRALVLADMPFLTYTTPAEALRNAGRLMQEGGAQAVKLEGGGAMVEVVQQLAMHGIPVCAHLGLLPQSVHKLGGYRVQGREQQQAEAIMRDALAMEAAGADLMLLESVPRKLAHEITGALRIPVIGIGAGPDCDAQVLVMYDLLGITPGKRPKFSKDFLAQTGTVSRALESYVQAVKTGSFPAPEHCFD